MRLLPTVALLVSFVAVGPAIAQSADEVNQSLAAIFGESEKFEVAFTALQDAVAADDPEAVAALVAYPLVVKVGERREIATPEEFVAGYEAIMTEEIEAAVTEQHYGDLITTDQGIGFGNGQVWMGGVCADDDCAVWDVRIITIQSTAE